VTYSLVVRDPETGDLGVGVQTCAFAVGAGVPWARPGVGAVATQSFTDRGYGPLGLELMAAGKTPEQALAALVAADDGAPVRQVGMVDAQGRVATHTGSACIAEAGHTSGDGFTAQANMMASATVWGAMAEAFSAAQGTLAERILDALDAAEAEGGDWRGQQASALLVVSGEPSAEPWSAKIADLRVDDHPRPLEELRRLEGLSRAYRRLNRLEPGDDAEAAIAAAEEAGVGEPHLTFAAAAAWPDRDEAKAQLTRLLEAEPRYVAFVRLIRPLAEAAGIEPHPNARA
jgi:uncharacterized Ntn-hydrolase superfamily protein